MSVFAMLISLMLMVLVTTTMALTIVDNEMVMDYSRNKKTFQAADSGLVHGKVTLAHALSQFSLPPATDIEDIDKYVADAESGQEEGNRDISLLVDTGTHIEELLPRGSVNTFGITEEIVGGILVDYEAAANVFPTGVDRPAADDTTYRHVFHYGYTISSEGAAELGGQYNQATRVEQGAFDVEVQRPSFASYGYFTQTMKNQFDDQLVFFDGEVYGGPTHVNTAPPLGRAGFYGTMTFDGPFTAVQGAYEDSWLGGNPNPIFNDSVSWGVEQIEIPSNGWSQLRASVGDEEHAADLTPPTNAELRELLGLPASADPVDQGVYYSQNYNAGGTLNGGIFVNGNVKELQFKGSGADPFMLITVEATDGGAFNGTHTWKFQQNLSSEFVKVYLDGTHLYTFDGNLNGLIHVEGSVERMIGNGNLSGAEIPSGHQVTVSATGDIYIADHITYKDDPIANPDATNILGLFSSNGNIYLAEDAPNDLTLHATVMAVDDGHGVGAEGIVSGGSYVYNYANKGDWNLLGGLIENQNQTTGVYYSNGHVTGYNWKFTYDERFEKGLAPPYFPYVTRFLVEMQGIVPAKWGRKYY